MAATDARVATDTRVINQDCLSGAGVLALAAEAVWVAVVGVVAVGAVVVFPEAGVVDFPGVEVVVAGEARAAVGNPP